MRADSDPPATARRNRTRQRERMLAYLRATDRHPTAAEIWEALQPEFPRLSLGTVYRNLEVLVSLDEVVPVPTAGGSMRYDGDPSPHHHFHCERCGRIEDLAFPVPGALSRSLRRHCKGEPRRVRIDCYGVCARCAD